MFNLGLQAGEIAIMALPMALIIISGEIDLSVASIMGMASAVLGYLFGKGWPMPAIFVVVLLVGVVAGRSTACSLPRRPAVPGRHDRHARPVPRRGQHHLGPSTILELPGGLHQHRRQRVLGTNLSFSAAVFIVLAVIFARYSISRPPAGRST